MTLVVEMTRDEIVSGLLRLEPRLRERGITGLAIFGSRSRGDARPDSDIDILVEVERGKKFSLLDLVGVSHVVGDELGIPANMFMRRSLEPLMARTIEPDIVEVF
jgi:predicted nucleotidyltransferase